MTRFGLAQASDSDSEVEGYSGSEQVSQDEYDDQVEDTFMKSHPSERKPLISSNKFILKHLNDSNKPEDVSDYEEQEESEDEGSLDEDESGFELVENSNSSISGISEADEEESSDEEDEDELSDDGEDVEEQDTDSDTQTNSQNISDNEIQMEQINELPTCSIRQSMHTIDTLQRARSIQTMKASNMFSTTTTTAVKHQNSPKTLSFSYDANVNMAEKRQSDTDNSSKTVDTRSQFVYEKENFASQITNINANHSSPKKYLKQIDPLNPFQSQLTTTPYKQSISYGKSHLMVDAAFYNGRSFRVGWGPSGTFTVAGKATKSSAFAPVAIKKLNVFGENHSVLETEKLKNHIMFTTLLSESRTSSQNSEGMDEDESMVDGESTQHCAKLELHREIEFHTISSIIASQPNIFSAEESQTWKLLICLFDKLPLNAILKKFDQDVAERFLRKDAISRWLIDACAASVNQDLLNCKTSPNRIYLHLTGRKIAAAVKECLAGNDFRLSTVLAQLAGAGSNVSVNSEGHVYSTNGLPGRVSTKKQLNVESITYDLQLQCQYWTNNQQFKFMNEWYQSIWKLIGGDVSQWNEKVFIKSLDWKRTLGLFFWYSFGGQSTLKDSILQYETNFNVEVIKKPTPHYLKGNLKETVYDINYHLLKLHEFDDYALEEMLEPKTYSSYLDYRQSWLIGYLINLKDIRRYKDEQTIDKQTMNLVLQLEMMGDWKWAVFVSLYLTNAIQREKIVRLLISIWYPITDHSGSIYYDLLTNTDMGVSTPTKSDIYSFLVDDLSIPSIWIHESRALKAKYGGSLLQYCICLIDSEQFELAYTTLLTKIVHSRILTGKLKFVCKILESLPKNDIPDWNIGGAIILKYYQVVNNVMDMNEAHSLLQMLAKDVIPSWTKLYHLSAQEVKVLTVSVKHMSQKLVTLLLDNSQLEKSIEVSLEGNVLLPDVRGRLIKQQLSALF